MTEYIERAIRNAQAAYRSMDNPPMDEAKFIADFLAADVAPVRHGRWEQRRDCTYCTACGIGYKIRFGVLSAKTYKFCPNCGAKMDGDDDNA